MNKTIYITGTDSALLSAQIASGYQFINPANNTTNYYLNTATGIPLTENSFTQSFSGSTFDENVLVYKRYFTYSSSVSSIDSIYSEFFPIYFSLSGIDDSTNNITKIEFEPLSGKIIIDDLNFYNVYKSTLVYSSMAGTNLNSPKYTLFKYKYNVTGSDDSNIFTPRFSAFRQDGLVDIYTIEINVSKDSLYNVSDEIKLLDTQLLPLSSKDPLLKLELNNPNYVNNMVIKRFITPTKTRTYTPSKTKNRTPTRTKTRTRSRTRTQSPTVTRTSTHTPTQTKTRTNSPTRSRTPTKGVTKTRTHTPSRTYITNAAVPPNPEHNAPNPQQEPTITNCLYTKYAIIFTSQNDILNNLEVRVGLKVEDKENSNKFLTYTTVPENLTFGNNSVYVTVPSDIDIEDFSFYYYYKEEDPVLSLTSIFAVDTCINEPPESTLPKEIILKIPLPNDDITFRDGPIQILPPVPGQETIPVVCNPPYILDPIDGKCKLPPASLECPDGLVYNHLTNRCELPNVDFNNQAEYVFNFYFQNIKTPTICNLPKLNFYQQADPCNYLVQVNYFFIKTNLPVSSIPTQKVDGSLYTSPPYRNSDNNNPDAGYIYSIGTPGTLTSNFNNLDYNSRQVGGPGSDIYLKVNDDDDDTGRYFCYFYCTVTVTPEQQELLDLWNKASEKNEGIGGACAELEDQLRIREVPLPSWDWYPDPEFANLKSIPQSFIGNLEFTAVRELVPKYKWDGGSIFDIIPS